MNQSMELRIPRRVWIEMHDDAERDACDVTVEMEDGTYYTALFVTLPYLRRQMELTFEVARQLHHEVPLVRYATMETPHILVEELSRDVIEDTIDNLVLFETFESLFTPVLEQDETGTTPSEQPAKPDRRLSTAEVAAVVLTEVLRAEGETVA